MQTLTRHVEARPYLCNRITTSLPPDKCAGMAVVGSSAAQHDHLNAKQKVEGGEE